MSTEAKDHILKVILLTSYLSVDYITKHDAPTFPVFMVGRRRSGVMYFLKTVMDVENFVVSTGFDPVCVQFLNILSTDDEESKKLSKDEASLAKAVDAAVEEAKKKLGSVVHMNSQLRDMVFLKFAVSSDVYDNI